MSMPQGYEKAPQIKRKTWLKSLRYAVAVQLGVAVGTKFTETVLGIKVGEPIAQSKGGSAFHAVANALMKIRCDATGKSYDKHSVILEPIGTTAAERKESTKRTLGAKLNSVRNFYLASFAFIATDLLPDVKRDALGNVQRKDLFIVEGDKKIINPIVAGKVEQAKWVELQGVPQVAGRSTEGDSLLDDDDSDDDLDF